MNALTGNKTGLYIFCSIDMNALTGNAQNHIARSIIQNVQPYANFLFIIK
jgi:hypothetical protein